MPARWKRCVASTDRALGDALGQKFVEVAFSGSSKTKALQLVGEIEKEMSRDIHDAAWMTPGTKDQALTKLQMVTQQDRLSREVERLLQPQNQNAADFFGDSDPYQAV